MQTPKGISLGSLFTGTKCHELFLPPQACPVGIPYRTGADCLLLASSPPASLELAIAGRRKLTEQPSTILKILLALLNPAGLFIWGKSCQVLLCALLFAPLPALLNFSKKRSGADLTGAVQKSNVNISPPSRSFLCHSRLAAERGKRLIDNYEEIWDILEKRS